MPREDRDGAESATQMQRWSSVGEFITTHMAELGMSQIELARAANVSDATLRRLQRGEPGNYRPAVLAKIGIALGWGADAIQRVLDGDEPRRVARLTPETARSGDLGVVLERLAAIEERITAVEEQLGRYGDERMRGPHAR